MKKQFLNLGKALGKAEQRSLNGGGSPKDPCPCSANYTVVSSSECTFPGIDPMFPDGLCLGEVIGDLCCL